MCWSRRPWAGSRRPAGNPRVAGVLAPRGRGSAQALGRRKRIYQRKSFRSRSESTKASGLGRRRWDWASEVGSHQRGRCAARSERRMRRWFVESTRTRRSSVAVWTKSFAFIPGGSSTGSCAGISCSFSPELTLRELEPAPQAVRDVLAEIPVGQIEAVQLTPTADELARR